MLYFKQGHVKDAEETVIAHGINWNGTFGYDIAYSIAAKYPPIYQAYAKAHAQKRLANLRSHVMRLKERLPGPDGPIERERVVIGMMCWSQYAAFDHGPLPHVEYTLDRALQWCETHGYPALAIPEHLTGRDPRPWDERLTLFYQVATRHPKVKLVVYKGGGMQE